MPEFLTLLPPTEALQLWFANLPIRQPSLEHIKAADALGRINAREITSPESLPAFDRSTVDGYAVIASDTFGSSETLPAYLKLDEEIPMGSPAVHPVKQGRAAPIHTGGMLPPGANAVIMLEHTQLARPGELEILRPVAPLENILTTGEDLEVGELILKSGVRLRPADIGGLMALGILEIDVFRKPSIAILSSGDEVIPPDQKPNPGQVRDINSYSLGSLVQHHGGIPHSYGILPDREEEFFVRLNQALEENDGAVVTAGSSASTRDLTARVIQRLGSPGVLVHGVNVKPGKPTILAVCNGKPVVGLPGNPVSALVVANLFLVPLLQRLSGATPTPRPTILAHLAINLSSQAGREDWFPVRLGQSESGWQAEPVFYKSNLIFSLVQADGLIRISPESTGLSAGEVVEVYLL